MRERFIRFLHYFFIYLFYELKNHAVWHYLFSLQTFILYHTILKASANIFELTYLASFEIWLAVPIFVPFYLDPLVLHELSRNIIKVYN